MKENPKCKHCGQPMVFKVEGINYYLYLCENLQCNAWHNSIEVPKTILAGKLGSK